MSEIPSFPTSLGTSDRTSITLLGQDLAHDLMGQVSFGELAYWLITLKRPTPQQTRLFETVLLGLADHGFTPTAIAARLTYLSAPDAIQGALAAGLLGGGSRYLGVTEDTGRFLAEVLAAAPGPRPALDDEAGWDALAEQAVAAQQRAQRPGGLGELGAGPGRRSAVHADTGQVHLPHARPAQAAGADWTPGPAGPGPDRGARPAPLAPTIRRPARPRRRGVCRPGHPATVGVAPECVS